MNARELHDEWKATIERGDYPPQSDEVDALVLRALDLLARVEESEDELVRNLSDRTRMIGWDVDGGAIHRKDELCELAAAALVEIKARAEKAEAERDRLKAERDNWKKDAAMVLGQRDQEHIRANNAEAERDALRGHAEAMANAGTGQVYVEANRKAVLAYRAAFPKDAP